MIAVHTSFLKHLLTEELTQAITENKIPAVSTMGGTNSIQYSLHSTWLYFGICPMHAPTRLLGYLKLAAYHGPVDHVPEGADVLRPAVLVLKVVGVFPHVQSEDGNHGLACRALH